MKRPSLPVGDANHCAISSDTTHYSGSSARRDASATLGHSSVATTGSYLHGRPTESSSKYLAV